MQNTIEEQQQRIEILERHCGIEFNVSSKPANRQFNPTNMEITLNLTSSNPTPSASSSPAPKSPSKNNNGNASPAAAASESKNDDDAKSPTDNKKKGGKNKDKDSKNSSKSRLGARGRGRDNNDRQTARASRSRGAVDRSRGRGGARGGARGGGGNDKGGGGDSEIIEVTDSEYTTKNLNLIFKSYKEDAIKLIGNGKGCKKLDMQNGSIQFGKDMLYETDYEKNNILKYRMIFDTNGSKITSGVGFGIAFIDHFNQWGSRNSGDNNSFHIRGDGKTFISDGFEIISDSFEKGKKAQLILKEGNLVCVELNLEKFEFKVWNLTVARENGIDDTENEECDKIVVKISDGKKKKKLGFIVYLGGSKSKTLSIQSATAFYAK